MIAKVCRVGENFKRKLKFIMYNTGWCKARINYILLVKSNVVSGQNVYFTKLHYNDPLSCVQRRDGICDLLTADNELLSYKD